MVDVETAVLMDMTFLPEGWREVLQVHDPSKVVIAFDHLVPAPTVQAATAHRTGRRFAAQFGIERLHDVGLDQGIAHAVVADRGYAIPGTVLVNGDSHTCAAGAFNCAARGVGGPDMLYAITMGKAWFRVGETIRYDFSGALRPGVSAKDIFLFIAGTYGAHVNQNVEYGGPGMATLSMNGRRTLATMGAELSAEFTIFEPDDMLTAYMRQVNPSAVTFPTMPDPDCVYRERRGIDLGTLEPLVALPDAVVNNSVPVGQVAGQHIDQAFVGSCANGTLDDLAVVAHVVNGRRVAKGTRLIVTPGTQTDLSRRVEGGLRRNHYRGGRYRYAGHLRRLRRRSSRRGWAGRGLPHRQHAQFQRPDGRSLGADFHGLAGDLRRVGVDRRHHPSGRILRRRQGMSSGSNALGGKVWKFGDNINTDLMLPGPWLYRSAEEQAKAVFINNRPEFLREMQQGDVIIGGFNYGMGSSRPAARSLRNCGVGFLLAEALNGLFFRNAVNFGFRAFECPGSQYGVRRGRPCGIVD